MWRKLLKLRPLALEFTRMEVNNGSYTSFWFDQWSHLGVLINLTGERGCIDLGIPINATVEIAVQSYRQRMHRTSVLLQIEKEILLLRMPGLGESDDIYLWKWDNGDFRPGFLSSQTWNMIRLQAPRVPWYKGIWFREATPKYSFIVWLAAHNRLSTGDTLFGWNSQAISTCWLCKSAMESRDHLFLKCPYSTEVWCGTVRGLISTAPPVHWPMVMLQLVTGLPNGTLTFLFRYCFQAVVYAIWYECNKRRLGEAPQFSNRLITFLDQLIRNRISSFRRRMENKHEKAMEI